jgi:ketosteroid isomerase-like protein
MNPDQLLKQGIAAYKAGRQDEARELFYQTLELDRDNEQAWMWLSGVVETDLERRICLEEVLALNPNNAVAKRGLEYLQALGIEPAAPEPLAPEPVVTPEPPPVTQVAPMPMSEEALPAPVPLEPDYQSLPPEAVERVEDKPKRDIGAWVFGAVILVLICLIACIGFAILGSLTEQDANTSAPTDSPSTIMSVVYENIAAHNAEDVERYMATLHSDAPNYDKTRDVLSDMYRNYDIQHTITGVELLESTKNRAEVSFVLTTKKVRGPEFRDNRVTGVFILKKEDGRWKLYDQKTDDIEYLE